MGNDFSKDSWRVVAFGGGHGLYASLSALRLLTNNITAVVTVADDGGSSGRLRNEFTVLPPGDLRMAVAALCEDNEFGESWRKVLQYRFCSEGDLDGHALGNLLLVALWQMLDDPVAGLKLLGDLLKIRGKVLPMSNDPLMIEADIVGAGGAGFGAMSVVRSQKEITNTGGQVQQVRLLPEDSVPCLETLAEIAVADYIIFGPGSWYTSVIPHLLLPQVAEALQESVGKKILVMNLAPSVGETAGMSFANHLVVLKKHAPYLIIDIVVVDILAVVEKAEFELAAKGLGATVVFTQLASTFKPKVHDKFRLAAAYQDIFNEWQEK